MSERDSEQITIELPRRLYHVLRREAKRQGVELPDFVKRKIKLKPSEVKGLAKLPLSEILARTAPIGGEDRLDFFTKP